MTYQKTILIKAKSDAEAQEIAAAMSSMSGHFTAKEWTSIGKKLASKVIQMRIRLMI